MCFSAAGSFAVAGLMSGVGGVALRRNRSSAHTMVAAIPLIFAAQQISEGVVWLTTPASTAPAIHHAAVVFFLACALVVWPVWLPFSLQRVERVPERRRILRSLTWAGVIVAASGSMLLARQAPFSVVMGHSIRYDRAGTGGSPVLDALTLLAYLLPTVVPFFISTMRLARTIGAALIVSLIITFFVERDSLTSVWCFFAALLSVLVLLAIEGDERRARV